MNFTSETDPAEFSTPGMTFILAINVWNLRKAIPLNLLCCLRYKIHHTVNPPAVLRQHAVLKIMKGMRTKRKKMYIIVRTFASTIDMLSQCPETTEAEPNRTTSLSPEKTK